MGKSRPKRTYVCHVDGVSYFEHKPGTVFPERCIRCGVPLGDSPVPKIWKVEPKRRVKGK